MGREGIVEDWEMAEKVWEYSFSSRLTGAKPSNPMQNGLNDDLPKEELPTEMEVVEGDEKPLADSPLLMTESGWNPTKAREKTIEIAMETWGTPAFYLARNGVLSAYVFVIRRPTTLGDSLKANVCIVSPPVKLPRLSSMSELLLLPSHLFTMV